MSNDIIRVYTVLRAYSSGLTFPGWLYVRIMEARGLPGVAMNGLGLTTSDPYATLQLTDQVSSDQSVRSPTDHKDAHNAAMHFE